MTRKLNDVVFFMFMLLLVFSCKSKKDFWYFQDLQDNQQTALNFETTEIQYNDILSIKLSALNPESILPYHFDNSVSPNVSSTDILKLQGYLVERDGTISYPILGRIQVAGKSTKDLEIYLKHLLEDGGHVNNPSVSVRILNYKVTVLGEVAKPGTYTITEQNISLPQVLGYAGDLTIHAERKNIMVIRDVGGDQVVKHIDLTKSDWFTSPFYYVRQNDVIVVSANDARVKSAGFIGNAGTFMGIISILLTTIVLITR
ncbi:MAG: polysaccharide biosynthesis/export family protein [Flavobacteriaceae bacterium]|nr:polysaccharide biosynthesis/export family protein [Flavobacteriaceae bacterium]